MHTPIKDRRLSPRLRITAVGLLPEPRVKDTNNNNNKKDINAFLSNQYNNAQFYFILNRCITLVCIEQSLPHLSGVQS